MLLLLQSKKKKDDILPVSQSFLSFLVIFVVYFKAKLSLPFPFTLQVLPCQLGALGMCHWVHVPSWPMPQNGYVLLGMGPNRQAEHEVSKEVGNRKLKSATRSEEVS